MNQKKYKQMATRNWIQMSAEEQKIVSDACEQANIDLFTFLFTKQDKVPMNTR